jgi:hypothetical protein
MFKYVLEIAQGLVIVDGESEFDLFHDSFQEIMIVTFRC